MLKFNHPLRAYTTLILLKIAFHKHFESYGLFLGVPVLSHILNRLIPILVFYKLV